ncbi:putative aspartic peptidase A1 family, xylanase inhibitor [Lupinus albus]|uniref:Putative aspartic peptidase A1 family, xylanase inhibitor n=1 Tax=Lupinus albus TaxID=3870 RepID=A0A6A4R7C7_LUPAL|nr:putative aspartic peptidase A1 family, xylanase inhibitor [Lupinus albus]
MIFGCGHNNKGTFSDKMMNMVGLGSGSMSLISQIGPSFGGCWRKEIFPLLSRGKRGSGWDGLRLVLIQP